MNNLAFFDTETIDELAWPTNPNQLTVDSPALDFFTDFTEHQPLVIDVSTSALEAQTLMKKAHVWLKVVVNANNHFLGVVSLDELRNQEILKRTSKGLKREELTLTDFMRHRNELKALSFDDLQNATIGCVIKMLQDSGQQHCLVIDRGEHQIRGIFSSSEIARRLKLPLDVDNRASFASLYKQIKHW